MPPPLTFSASGSKEWEVISEPQKFQNKSGLTRSILVSQKNRSIDRSIKKKFRTDSLKCLRPGHPVHADVMLCTVQCRPALARDIRSPPGGCNLKHAYKGRYARIFRGARRTLWGVRLTKATYGLSVFGCCFFALLFVSFSLFLCPPRLNTVCFYCSSFLFRVFRCRPCFERSF